MGRGSCGLVDGSDASVPVCVVLCCVCLSVDVRVVCCVWLDVSEGESDVCSM